MEYRAWPGGGPTVSRLGFGTTHLPIGPHATAADLERCVSVVLRAIERGVNYFDVAPTYSNGHAESVLGRAFREARAEVHVCAKTGLSIDATSDDLLRRLERSLSVMGLSTLDFYCIWSLMGKADYERAIAPGGLYEGAMRAKEEGFAKRIIASLHCSPAEAFAILDEGLFDGMVISMNALNWEQWEPVINRASELGVGIVTMNSLAGGLIPRYPELFARLDETNNAVSTKALRFLAGFSAVTVILSGMASNEEVDENSSALELHAQPTQRLFKLPISEPLCSGCGYCKPCPKGVPIPECMQAFNHSVLMSAAEVSLDSTDLANGVFARLRGMGVVYPEVEHCVGCGACERRCTQSVPIRARLSEMRGWAENACYTAEAISARIEEVKAELAEFDTVGLMPSCLYASRMLDLIDDAAFEDKLVFMNSSHIAQDSLFRGKKVFAPEDALKQGVEAIMVASYEFQEEIVNQVKDMGFEATGGHIAVLHRDGDVDWFSRFL